MSCNFNFGQKKIYRIFRLYIFLFWTIFYILILAFSYNFEENSDYKMNDISFIHLGEGIQSKHLTFQHFEKIKVHFCEHVYPSKINI